MNIAITGHTKGIGKGLLEYFLANGDTVIGFSRSNGYDISYDNVRTKILNEILDCDVFINNAYDILAQEELFKLIYGDWKSTNKTIINIISKVKYYNIKDNYVQSKRSFAKVAEQCALDTNNCRIININPGYVDTGFIDPAFKQQLGDKFLSIEELSSIIGWCANQPHRINISELSVWVTGS